MTRLLANTRRHGDVVLAVALVGIVVAQTASLEVSSAAKAAVIACAIVVSPAIVWRVRAPLVLLGALVAIGALGSFLPARVLDVEAFGFILLLGVYTAAAHTAGWRTWLAAAMTALLGLIALFRDPDGVSAGGVVFFALLFGAPFAAGKVVQRRRVGEARMRGERDAAQTAMVEERARIARELHDVVAHAIGVIVLQARGGRRLLDSSPLQTREALETIERTGQQALVEMRRLVGLLREADDGEIIAPQPTLAQLPRLLDQMRSAGLAVDLDVEGDAVELPPGVELSAYRIVQEALTNALKHAGPATVQVILRYESEQLDIEVADDGAGATSSGLDGHGLVGMRERVNVVGGELDAGPRHEGGFAVRATLPYGAPA